MYILKKHIFEYAQDVAEKLPMTFYTEVTYDISIKSLMYIRSYSTENTVLYKLYENKGNKPIKEDDILTNFFVESCVIMIQHYIVIAIIIMNVTFILKDI